MLSKLLDVGFWYNLVMFIIEPLLIDPIKALKFSKLKLTTGNEMIRTSWFGRHNFVPYIRIDLWKIGFRISYDPDYYKRYFNKYRPFLSAKEHQRIMTEMEAIKINTLGSDTVEVTRGSITVREPIRFWYTACKKAKETLEF